MDKTIAIITEDDVELASIVESQVEDRATELEVQLSDLQDSLLVNIVSELKLSYGLSIVEADKVTEQVRVEHVDGLDEVRVALTNYADNLKSVFAQNLETAIQTITDERKVDVGPAPTMKVLQFNSFKNLDKSNSSD